MSLTPGNNEMSLTSENNETSLTPDNNKMSLTLHNNEMSIVLDNNEMSITLDNNEMSLTLDSNEILRFQGGDNTDGFCSVTRRTSCSLVAEYRHTEHKNFVQTFIGGSRSHYVCTPLPVALNNASSQETVIFCR